MYDFIVVGAGSAGCLVASRLIRFGYTVLLLEAGGPETEITQDATKSGVLVSNYFNNYFWTEGNSQDPQSFPFIGGRLEGGGSSVNGMQFVRGTNAFFNDWSRRVGDERWNAKSAAKAYNFILKYLSIRSGAANDNAANAFATAFTAVTGLPVTPDYNDPATPFGPNPECQLFQFSNGTRCSSAQAFLSPIQSQRLTVKLHATVVGLDFKGRDCHQIHAIVDGEETCFRAERVILCSGFNNAPLLMRNGFGPRAELQEFEIPVHTDLPAVGKHLRNQLLLNTVGKGVVPLPTNPDPQAVYSGMAFSPQILPGKPEKKRRFQWVGTVGDQNTYGLGVVPLEAQSQGTMRLLSTDPLQAPKYSFNYLSTDKDISEIVEAGNLTNQILRAMGLTPTIELWTPELVKTMYGQTYHWVGGCSMDTKEHRGVVGTDGRLHGTTNVYIADASIIPQQINDNQPDGNTEGAGALPVGYIIAEQFRRHC